MIERIHWTDHAEQRVVERGLTREEVETAILGGLKTRIPNRGNADWRVYGDRPDGRRFVVAYDHPVFGSSGEARVVTVWTLRM